MAGYLTRHKQAQAERASGAAISREIPVPLPVSGIYAQARTAEVGGALAAELVNWESTGADLETRKPMQVIPGNAALQRIPFEFGENPGYIEITSGAAQCRGAILPRTFNGQAMVGYISGQAIICDGLNDPVLFNGTTFSTSAWTTGDTNVDPATFDGVIVHHDRPYFWRSSGGDLEFFYGDVGAVQGVLTRYPLGRLGNITGTLSAMVSLSIDAGDNANDALAIMTSTGEVVVFEGLDPGDADTWNLVSRVKVAPPLSRFGHARIGGDVWMMTASGIVSLLDSQSRGAMALVSEIAEPIAQMIREDVLSGAAEWQVHMQADGAGVIVNRLRGTDSLQYVYAVAGKSWSVERFPARRWHNLGAETHFTTLQRDGLNPMMLARRGGAEGEAVTAIWHTGWLRLGRYSHIKHVRPHILGRGPVQVRIAVLSDHRASAAEVAAATQTITLRPDNAADAGGFCAMNHAIPVGIDGAVFQLRIEVTAPWAKIVSLQAGV